MLCDDSVVYLGEDVKHGGYHVVTEGLAEKFPGRLDSDETSPWGRYGFARLA
jgi:pyruvate/2-oxoglutarate/acetoin dehydrogenase E1 component